MIPRYAPTYTWMDLIAGFQLSSNSKVEEELCSRIESLFNIQYVFLFGSGREALYAALKAYGHPGRVLIPAYNCIVVPEAIQFAGYSPTFVDIDRSSFNMTAESVERAITSDVKVVFLTHLFGIPCDIQSILNVLHEREIFIIEDAAPALGAEYQGKWVGSFGDATVISFQSTKVISGEVGGALLTNNRNFAQKVMELQLEAVAPNNAWLVLTKALIRKLVTSQGLYGLAQIGYRA
jgi:perosamine synthetase